MLLLAGGLFLSSPYTWAQDAKTPKWGKIRARHSSFSIVVVEPLESYTDAGGVYVLSIDKNHVNYLTLFSGLTLRSLGIDRDKFMLELQRPNTIVDCNTDDGTIVLDGVNFVFCGKNFQIRHQ